jgi:hypothetical protein
VNGGYVALLDVLGFSALIGADPSGDRVRRYIECLENATEDTEVDFVVFSDSIVLTAKGDSPQSLIAVSGACSRLMAHLLNEGIPLRGAIAFGDFVRSRIAESVFVAGRAVIDAYQFEQAQNWVGVMIAPSALAQVPDLNLRCQLVDPSNNDELERLLKRLPWPAFIQPCHRIPFRASAPLDEPTFDGFAVVPTKCSLEPEAIRDSIKITIDRLNWLRSIAPSPSAQRKYDEPRNWLSSIQHQWHIVGFRQEQLRH